MMRSLKFIILIFLLISLTGCGTIINTAVDTAELGVKVASIAAAVA